MATRRGRQRSIARAKSPNYGAVTRGARGVRVLSARVVGRPAGRLLKGGSNSMRSIRTLIARDPAKGITQPEYRQAMLMDQGVHMSGEARGVTIKQQRPEGAVGANRGSRVVKPPRKGPLGRRNKGV